MPQIIEVPNFGQVEFPDGMSDADIVSAIKKTSMDYGAKPDKGGLLSGSVMSQVADMSRALGHHAMNLPHGLAQGVENLVNLGAQQLPDNAVSRAINRTVTGDNAEMAQREKDYQDKTGNTLGAYAGATAGEIAPFALNAIAAPLRMGGDLVSKLASRQLPDAVSKMGGQVASGAAQGAAIGAAQPVNDADYWKAKAAQMESGAAFGGTFPLAIKAGAGVYQGAKDVLQPLINPMKSAAERLAGMTGQDAQQLAEVLRKYPIHVPGSTPTTAQVLATPEAVQLEKAMLNNPEFKAKMENIGNVNNSARLDAVNSVAKTQAEFDAAKGARTEATKPLYESMDKKMFLGGTDMQSLLARLDAAGALKEGKSLAGINGKKFSIPMVEDAANRPVTMADLESLNAQRPTHPDLQFGGVPADYPGGSQKVLGAIRARGGLHMSEMRDLVGETATNRSGAQVGVFTGKGQELGDMAEQLVAERVLPPSILEGNGGARNLAEIIHSELNPQFDKNAATMFDTHSLPGAYIEGQSAKPQEALQDLIGQAVRGGDLQAVKFGLDQQIGKATWPQKGALLDLKKDYVKWMGEQSPEYTQANSLYAELSKPVNSMDVGRQVQDSLLRNTANTQGNPNVTFTAYKNTLAKALKDSEYGANPADVATLKGVQDDLYRQTISGGLKFPGSDTAYNKHAQGWLSKQLYGNDFSGSGALTKAVGGVVGAGLGSAFGGVGAGVGATAGVGAALGLSKMAGGRVKAAMAEIMANPDVAAKELSKLTPSQRNTLVKLMEMNPMTQQLIQSAAHSP